MKDIEKDLFPKPVPIETTSIKPVERSVLSEDKSFRVSGKGSLSHVWLARFGMALKHRRRIVSIIQWLFVMVYLFLLFIPALIGNFANERICDDMSVFSRLIFWGTGWPLIVLSMMLFGRFWCGLFCPDGTLTEFISRYGQKRSIPRWIRWKGWPGTVLSGTVLSGQLIGVYDNYPATLILLGIPTSLALLCGFLYGNGKRIWCMYLCPANGLFGLLARLSPVYYKVDREKWKQYSGQPERIDCPALINVRQMQSTSACHACGRCIGHRNAVELGIRPPSTELLPGARNEISGSEMFLLLWGIIGICTAALIWRENGLYTRFIHLLSQPTGLPVGNAPWWMPANPLGFLLLIFIVLYGSVLALATYCLLRLASLASGNSHLWRRLALCLIPVSAFGIFLGLCQTGLAIWQTYGFHCRWMPIFQSMILGGAALFSIWLGIKTIFDRISMSNWLAFLVYCLPVILLTAVWISHFQV